MCEVIEMKRPGSGIDRRYRASVLNAVREEGSVSNWEMVGEVAQRVTGRIQRV